MNIKGINLYGNGELCSEEDFMYSESLSLVWNIADRLREPNTLTKNNSIIDIIFREEYLKAIKSIREYLINSLKFVLKNCTLDKEKRKNLERQLALLEYPNLVTNNISFDKKMNPIDCIVLSVSQKKIEVVSKIIRPIKEKVISVTDLLIIGNSRVLRI